MRSKQTTENIFYLIHQVNQKLYYLTPLHVVIIYFGSLVDVVCTAFEFRILSADMSVFHVLFEEIAVCTCTAQQITCDLFLTE